MEFVEKSFDTIRYLVRYPDGYKEGARYPVIIYLHGAGGRGDDINVIRTHSFFSITAEYKDFPFVCVAPLCYANTWFDIFEKLQNFAQHISESEFCDPERLYLMGASMGGYTTWQLAMSRPELFAAIVPYLRRRNELERWQTCKRARVGVSRRGRPHRISLRV